MAASLAGLLLLTACGSSGGGSGADTIVIENSAFSPSSLTVAPGKAGRYSYMCTIHQYMTGTLVVR